MHEAVLKVKNLILPYLRRRAFPFELAELLLSALLASAAYGTTGLAPLGTACVAAVFLFGVNPYYALTGAVCGALLGGNYASAAACALFCAACVLFRAWRGNLKNSEKLMLLVVTQLALLPVFYMRTLESAMIGLSSAALSVVAAAALKNARAAFEAAVKKRMLTNVEQASLVALGAFIVFSMRGFAPFDISAAALFAAFFSLAAAGAKGPASVAASVVFGASGVLTGGASMLFLGTLAACTLCASFLRRAGRWGLVGGFFAPAALFAYFVGGINSLSVWEAGLACGLFALLPRRMAGMMEAAALPPENEQAKRALLIARSRLNDLASVVKRLGELFDPNDEAQSFLSRQMSGVCGALNALAEESYPPRPHRRYEVRIGAAACPKEGNRETGDSMGMREAGGNLLLMLSDGMGTGEAAHRESAAAVALLGDLLSVGFGLENALECVNRLLLLRKKSDMYATLDAALIDLRTGSARFVKFGAPPSYILRDGKVITVYAEALPIGVMKDARAAVQSAALKHGDALVLMTDGAFDALGTELFASLLEHVYAANTADDAANALLRCAREKSGADDISVLVARIV
ncbi:MAG: PP2C family protein-serine/threonine phosphatase [Clostridiaceae bacterium]|nr:serine/threonine-protein phosphatase [Eubacteriales bacterium]